MTFETPALVTKLRQSGSGRVFYEDRVHEYTVDPSPVWISNYEFAITLGDGREIILSDAYETMGFVYRAPDSGTQMTNVLVPLNDEEPDPVGIPDRHTMVFALFDAMMPVFKSVQRGDTDPDDLDMARQVFSSPEAMLRTIQREGGLKKAQEAILRDVFGII